MKKNKENDQSWISEQKAGGDGGSIIPSDVFHVLRTVFVPEIEGTKIFGLAPDSIILSIEPTKKKLSEINPALVMIPESSEKDDIDLSLRMYQVTALVPSAKVSLTHKDTDFAQTVKQNFGSPLPDAADALEEGVPEEPESE